MARLALRHLLELGHRQIAVLRGQPFSSEAADRWKSICDAAQELGILIPAEFAQQLDTDDPSPEAGCRLTRELLSRGRFTALIAYNDIAAIEAIRAIREGAYYLPSLTTIRQPLRKMGEIAAETLVQRIEGRTIPQILIEPELVVRESTASSCSCSVGDEIYRSLTAS